VHTRENRHFRTHQKGPLPLKDPPKGGGESKDKEGNRDLRRWLKRNRGFASICTPEKKIGTTQPTGRPKAVSLRERSKGEPTNRTALPDTVQAQRDLDGPPR